MLKISDVKKIDAREKVQKMLTKSKGKLKTSREFCVKIWQALILHQISFAGFVLKRNVLNERLNSSNFLKLVTLTSNDTYRCVNG